MTIGTRAAQGPKSKAFHFAARVCKICNSSRTQAADKEFDRFSDMARSLLEEGASPSLAFQHNRYEINSVHYLNLFRYFAKILCCHMAELRLPRHIHMSRFAIGRANRNCVWLGVDEDWKYKEIVKVSGHQPYAAHGGLVIYAVKKTGRNVGFHSTLSVGRLRFVFFHKLTWPEKIAFLLSGNSMNAEQDLSEEDHLDLGLK